MLVSQVAVVLGFLAVHPGLLGMLLSLVVAPMFVVMRCFPVMVSGCVVMEGRGMVVML
jgi:hypothetical protein